MVTHRTLTTIEAVFKELGDIQGVSELTNCNRKAVWMWKYLKKFPSDTFLIMKDALADKGFRAKPELWGMKQKERA